MVGSIVVASLATAGGAFITTAGALTLAGTVAAMAINFAVSSIVSRAFAPDLSGKTNNGNRQQLPPSTRNAIPVVYGDAYLGGTFVDAVLSKNQKMMYYVMAISGISPNGQFTFDTTDMYYGDRKITFDSVDQSKVISLTDEAGNVDTKIANRMYIGLYTSNASGVITNVNWYAPSVIMGPTSPFIGDDQIDASYYWPSSGRQMNGLAFAIIALYYDEEAGTTALQPVTFKVKHALNGTGVAKPGDVWYDYMTNPYYGGAVDAAYIDTASVTTLNNYSDELVTFDTYTGPASTQPRYRMNGVLNAGETVLSNVNRIMTCCDSWMAYRTDNGKWSAIVNKPEAASYAFNDSNIIGDIRVSVTDLTSSVNQIEATFPFKENRDQPEFVTIKVPDALLFANEPINKTSMSFDLVNDSVTAQYLANRILEQAREDLIISFSTTYYGIQVDAGNVVSVTNSAYGWTDKLFRVIKVNEVSLPDGSLGARLELSEYNAQVYDDKNITEFTPVPNSGLVSAQYFSALSAPTVIATRPTAAVPSFDVQVTIPTTGRVTYIQLFYTTVASPSPSDWFSYTIASTANSTPYTPGSNFVFLNCVLPAGTYYFGYRVGNDKGASAISPASSALSWSPVAPTGPTGAIGPTGPTGGPGSTGARNANGYVYYTLASSSAPSGPSASSYNFDTGAFTGLSANWTTTFSPPAPDGTSKFWACRYSVSESSYGGSQTISFSAVFVWQNFDGLVTFTNLASPAGTTFIDGGNIKTGTVSANTIYGGQIAGFGSNYFKIGTSASGNLMYLNMPSAPIGAPLVYWYDTSASSYPSFQLSTNSKQSSNGAAIQVNSQATGAIGLIIDQSGSSGGAAQFFNTGSSKQFWAAPGSYSAYSPSGGGKIYIVDGNGPFTGFHDSLTAITAPVEVGDIMVDAGLIYKQGISSTLFETAPSSSATQKRVIGIASGVYPVQQGTPGALWTVTTTSTPDGPMSVWSMPPGFDPAVVETNYKVVHVNALGEGQVNVCGQNGDIEAGDLIVTSDMPGKGMKQVDDVIRATTVAKARESVTFATPDEVKQIACIYLAG